MSRSFYAVPWASFALVVLVSEIGCGGPSSPPAGNSAKAQAAPERIASLTLATDEMLPEMVPAERIVCVTYLADDSEISNIAGTYPERIPRMRDADLER